MHQQDFDDMNQQHQLKLIELEEIRLRANEEIKRMSGEVVQVQAEINVMLMEYQKYESQVQFLMSERDMLIKA